LTVCSFVLTLRLYLSFTKEYYFKFFIYEKFKKGKTFLDTFFVLHLLRIFVIKNRYKKSYRVSIDVGFAHDISFDGIINLEIAFEYKSFAKNVESITTVRE
jgi:hypothetical protein